MGELELSSISIGDVNFVTYCLYRNSSRHSFSWISSLISLQRFVSSFTPIGELNLIAYSPLRIGIVIRSHRGIGFLNPFLSSNMILLNVQPLGSILR